MASYHLAVKSVSRSTGRSAPAASAYRTATRIENQRDGLMHDYTRRGGVEDAFLVLPKDAAWAEDRSALWNAAEAAEKRKDAKVAREYELALPHELDAAQRRTLAHNFGQAVVERFGVAADIAIHAAHPEGDQRNWHAHVLTTTRVVTAEGLGAKTRELDVIQTAGPAVEALRALWAQQVNQALERAQVAERVEHRSFARQGRDLVAEQHMGPAAAAIERDATAGRPMPSLSLGRDSDRQPATAGVAGHADEASHKPVAPAPVTRIGQHNAEVRERNSVAMLAQRVLEVARDRVGELEQAATQGARKVLGFARALGASIGGERRRQEAARQEQEAERVRQVEARRVEQERQAAEKRAARERTAAEQVWAQVQAAGELARQKEAEKAQQKVETERPAVTQRPRGPSMGR